ncbi:MAG TPA: hydrolase 2, exosortase A system-associated [Roseateles sp.]|nr:hydrolase 2, exosortase A system-associated [Roseateles sp.]
MQAFFLTAGNGGQRFCVYHPAQGEVAHGALLYVHPFAEEMNKARRMAALQACALADAGYAVLQIDLRGCGDSSDDFGDAGWSDWLANVELGLDWLAGQNPGRPLWLWGLRAGCLLAGAVAERRADAVAGLIYWQPMLSGKLQLQQFLRLRLAADLAGGHGQAVMADLRAELRAGRSVEIAGYVLAAALAEGLEAAVLCAPAPQQTLLWLELSARQELLPASQAWLERHAGMSRVAAHAPAGPAFWSTTEIEDAPDLIAATLAGLLAHSPAGNEVPA